MSSYGMRFVLVKHWHRVKGNQGVSSSGALALCSPPVLQHHWGVSGSHGSCYTIFASAKRVFFSFYLHRCTSGLLFSSWVSLTVHHYFLLNTCVWLLVPAPSLASLHTTWLDTCRWREAALSRRVLLAGNEGAEEKQPWGQPRSVICSCCVVLLLNPDFQKETPVLSIGTLSQCLHWFFLEVQCVLLVCGSKAQQQHLI